MKNAVIAYTGREGSSPLVWSLRKNSRVISPIFEDLDLINLKEFDQETVSPALPVVMKRVIETGQFNIGWLNKTTSIDRIPSRTDGKSVIFKWRPWGPIEEICSCFRETNTIVIFLIRQDILNLSLSLHYTFDVLPNTRADGIEGHVQFQMLKLSEGERRRVISEIQEQKFLADEQKLIPLMRQQIWGRRRLIEWKSALEKAGVEVRHVYYEDFLKDKKNTLARICEWLNLEFEEKMLDSHVVKVNRSNILEQLINREEIENSTPIKKLQNDWLFVCRMLADNGTSDS